MSVASRPVSTGKTRTCPHCKATILESLSICPGCMHHLRFDSEAAKRQVAAAPALRVEGMIRHPPLEQPLEYFVIIAIRNDRGEEVTRQVVNVGALQASEKRTFTLSVEVLPPQAPVAAKSTSATGAYKSPITQPTATVRPSAPASTTTSSSSAASSGSAAGASTGSVSGSSQPGQAKPAAGGTASPSGGSGQGGSAGTQGRPGTSGQGSSATRGQPGASGQGSAAQQGQPRTSGQEPAGTAPGQSGTSGQGSPNTPGQPGSSAQSPAGTQGQTKPAAPAAPASGYILKPPSPGGPKRH